ncbi:phage baseplate assembly protein V [Phenylobacterium sp.]|uniref:phage baseplate assembly protein V n=1 Tax=Phenylobacterium sp. TaxID=1871053 RepID=UPI00273149FC|nr:phage baseplate assembly protein V [Phenylobacterium sp.]MDP2214769.1 phage baseplate assembly protein V [Phenylobacterium sp.]
MRELAALARRVAELERRMANIIREGTVSEVDPVRKRVRLRLGGPDQAPFLSPWVRYAQQAGDLKVHAPPSVGQQMTLHSPAGDIRLGQALPYTWSEAQPSPSDAGDENVLTFGSVKISLTAEAVLVGIGETTLSISAEKIVLKAAEIATDGPTRLDGGDRPVVFAGSADSGGDTNLQGASRVYV